MTKQETIEKAYGEHWESVKDFVNEHGYCTNWHIPNFGHCYPDFSFHTDSYNGENIWIPSSIRNIENNNGWTKIESEQDLPERDKDYNVIAYDGRIYGAWLTRNGNWLNNKHNDLSQLTNVTHWREKIELPKPIY